MIEAIVLAAGESRRMGMPKSLLRFNETTFLEQIVGVLQQSDVSGITVVLGARARMVRAAVGLSDVNVVVNENYQEGQLSSLIAGIKGMPDEADAILLCLVDNPFISIGLVWRIIQAFRESQKPIVVPVFNGRRGHPALFAAAVFDELLNAPMSEGARYVVNADKARVLEVEIPDQRILAKIDTPADYASHFGVPPQIREER